MYHFYRKPATNSEVENRHLPVASFFLIGAICLHLISFSTEILSFYSMAFSEASKLLPYSIAAIFSGAFALLVSVVLEVGLYLFTAVVFHAVVRNHFNGEERPLYLLYSVFLLLLAGGSLFASFAGGEAIAVKVSENVAGATVDADSTANAYNIKRDSIGLYFDGKAAAVVLDATEKRKTAPALFEARKAPHNQNIQRLKAIRTKANFQYVDVKINNELSSIAKIDGELLAKIQSIDDAEKEQMAAIEKERETEKNILIADKDAAVLTATNTNTKTATDKLEAFNSANSRLWYLVLFALIGNFILAWAKAKRDKLTGTETVPIFSSTHGRNYFNERLFAFMERVNNKRFKALDDYKAATLPYSQPMPKATERLDYSAIIAQPVRKVVFRPSDDGSDGDGQNIVYIDRKTGKIGSAPSGVGNSPDPVIYGTIDGDDDGDDDVEYTATIPVSMNKGTGYNAPVTNGAQISRKIGDLVTCDFCGTEYRLRSINQRFDTPQCKAAFHAAKNGGREFSPQKWQDARKAKTRKK